MNRFSLLIGLAVAILVAVAFVIGWRVNQEAPLRLSLAVDPTPALRNPTAIRLSPGPEDPAVLWHENQLYAFDLHSTADVVTVRVDQTAMTLYLAGDVYPADYGCTSGETPRTHERQYRRGDRARIYACAPSYGSTDVGITLLDGTTIGEAYRVSVASGAPAGPVMPTPTPVPAPTPKATPHPSTLPAKPWHVAATHHGGDTESIAVSWARPPVDEAEATTENPAGVRPAGYRVERRECRSYAGGNYDTTEIDPNTNLPVTVSVSLAVPGSPDSQLCGDGTSTQLDPGAPDQFNPEWSPWGTVYDASANAVTYTVDGHDFPPKGDGSYSLRLQYRVAAYNSQGNPGEYSAEPYTEATIDRSSGGTG